MTPSPAPRKRSANTAPRQLNSRRPSTAATGIWSIVSHAVDEVAGVDLPALAAYNEAVAAAQQTPDGDTALAAHLESALVGGRPPRPTRCAPKPTRP